MRIALRNIAILVSAGLAVVMHPARADETAALTKEILVMDSNANSAGSGTVTTKIANDFQSFAGSKQNSTALVTGLRNGSEVTLTQKGYPSATFTPPTKPMGYGNVSTSLALAEHQLAQQGITNPTPEQMKIALNGGTITANGTTTQYQGVLQMRAAGAGWGEIAQQSGTKLGPVVSAIKSQNANVATTHATKHPLATSAIPGAGTNPSTSSNGAARSSSGGATKGIVNASGGNIGDAGHGSSDRGASTAGNGSVAPGKGIVTGAGHANSGATQGTRAGGHGVVTATGATAGGTATAGSGHGKAAGHAK